MSYTTRLTQARALLLPAAQVLAGSALLQVAFAGAAAAENPEVPPRELIVYRTTGSDELGAESASVIGAVRSYEISEGDTLLDLAREQELGYDELLRANPGIDPWLPQAGRRILLPTEWILPSGKREGIVVNIPELRLYYYLPKDGSQARGDGIVTYPVGLGRDEWRTPLADFRVRGKTKNPVWVLPETVKAERIAEKGYAENSIPGGHPDNPLGRHRIELTLGSYAIHGTNKNWGVGMQVSHGCIRLYPEDIAALFPIVEIGAQGRFQYEPVKVASREGRVLVEVHEDIYGLTASLWQSALEAVRQAGVEDRVDLAKLRAASEAATGIPTDVGRSAWPGREAVVSLSPSRGEGDASAVVLDAGAESERGQVP